jgi:hypothetical protein
MQQTPCNMQNRQHASNSITIRYCNLQHAGLQHATMQGRCATRGMAAWQHATRRPLHPLPNISVSTVRVTHETRRHARYMHHATTQPALRHCSMHPVKCSMQHAASYSLHDCNIMHHAPTAPATYSLPAHRAPCGAQPVVHSGRAQRNARERAEGAPELPL